MRFLLMLQQQDKVPDRTNDNNGGQCLLIECLPHARFILMANPLILVLLLCSFHMRETRVQVGDTVICPRLYCIGGPW